MTDVDQRLRLEDQNGTGLARLGAAAWVEIGKPDLAALRHLGRARSRRNPRSPACSPCELCAIPAPSALRARALRPRGSSPRRPRGYTRPAGIRPPARVPLVLPPTPPP